MAGKAPGGVGRPDGTLGSLGLRPG